MSGFRQADPEKAQEFLNQRAQEVRALNNMSDKYVTCNQCGFQCPDSQRQAAGWTACPQCGSTQCVVTDLPYNTRDPQGLPITTNPPPTPEEIAHLDRLQPPRSAR